MSTTEVCAACEPTPHLGVTDDVTGVIVEDAPIAHHEAARWKRDDVAERRDAIL
ncbi:MAG: hypothetical protein M3Y74_18670 [Chloroflexota bacterium]|nr:hypothetical protein [Chloroflexota bacterium]